jgi:2-keto-4-pentenoate hydratase/2-oxohepta-3-ene-1,7-dioic acid hydratase in catechol pathway
VKLVTYIHHEATHLGAIKDGQVLDLAKACAAYRQSPDFSADPVGFPADMECPGDMLTLLQSDEQTWQSIAIALDWAITLPEAAMDALCRPLEQVQLGPPLANPSKIICVGMNYHDHCREQDLAVPQRPLLFAKFPSAIIGPEEEITWPSDISQQVDYEAELAVIIGRKARDVVVEEAYDYIAGYTILNDVSARDVVSSEGQWVRGKSFDTFCPLGPYLLTADEVRDPHDLGIRCWVNGELRQDSVDPSF